MITNMTLANATLANATSLKPALVRYLADPIVIMSALPILLVIVIMIFVIRSVTPVSHFLYANSRIQARSNYTVKEHMVMELTEAKSLREFKSLLRETNYGEELEQAGEELRSVHIALEKGFLASILELLLLSPTKSQPLFLAYIQFFEAKILKVIYRAKLMGIPIDEDLVYAVGDINANLLKHILETETTSDMGVVMGSTAYAEIFENKYENLEEFEVRLDGFVLNNLVDTIKKTKMHDGRYIIDIMNKKIDVLNLLALLKFRIRGIEKDKQKSLLIENKTELNLRFDELIKAETLKDIVDRLNGMPYHEPMAKAFLQYEKDNALSHFENELYRFFKRFVESNELAHTLGPYPLFSYLIKREIELRNLFVISRGIDASFSVEKIREMVI